MKIRINKKQLFNGVKFKHHMVNLKDDNLKVMYCYLNHEFIIFDYRLNQLNKFDDYNKFRKRLTRITSSW